MSIQPISVAQEAAAESTSQVVAQLGIRICAYLIDCIPVVLLSFLNLIPIAGPMMCGFLVTPYWLLRDVTGASLGKLMLGLKVLNKDGSDSTTRQRVLRNVTLAAGPAFLIIPLIGIVLFAVIGGILGLIEIIFFLTQRERLGDRLAKTTVVKK